METRSSAERPCSASRTFAAAGTVPGEAISVLPESTKGGRVGVHPSSHSGLAAEGGRTAAADPDPDPDRSADRIGARARKHVHVFGHTHFGWDHTIDGIRYIQAPVSYPHEWKQRPGSLTVGPDSLGTAFDLSTRASDAPLCVWAPPSEGRGFAEEMRARWSDHYKEHPRRPEDTELMWWVKGDEGQSDTHEFAPSYAQ